MLQERRLMARTARDHKSVNCSAWLMLAELAATAIILSPTLQRPAVSSTSDASNSGVPPLNFRHSYRPWVQHPSAPLQRAGLCCFSVTSQSLSTKSQNFLRDLI